MFKFLKDKITKAVSRFSRKAEEEADEEKIETGEEASEKTGPEAGRKEGKGPDPSGKSKQGKEQDPAKAESQQGSGDKAICGKDKEEGEENAPELPEEERERESSKEEPLREKGIDKGLIPEEERKKEEIIDKAPPGKEAGDTAGGQTDQAEARIGEERDASQSETHPDQEQKGAKGKEHEISLREEEKKDDQDKPDADEKEPDAKGKSKEKRGFFSRIRDSVTLKRISREKFEELFWDLELALLENNVAVEVIEKIKDDLAAELVDKPIPRSGISRKIISSLRSSIEDLLESESFDIFGMIPSKKPYVICFIGVNGSGKTTTIAKFAHLLQEKGYSVVLAAADTFRAAAIDQLALHAERLGAKIIRHDYGSDAAAVAFDAVKHAESKGKDVVLIDTAGRLHSNKNLMDELRKVIRVAKPDLKIFVGESIIGNDCVEQAKQFNESVGIDAIILSKADIDEKGGASISVGYVTKKPILFIGTGQDYKDIEPFDRKKIIADLGL